jgi:hypothetical protein
MDVNDRHDKAEEIGRIIGIVLHWLIVKPIYALFLIACNASNIISCVLWTFMAGSVALIFWFILLAILT